MRFYFYDLGAHFGQETRAMLDIFGRLHIEDFHIFMFEPCAQTAWQLKELTDSRVTLTQRAIGPSEVKASFYHTADGNPAGHSLFRSKYNVIDDCETVQCFRFSDWLAETVLDFREAINILKFNIEGAEWFLVQDLADKKLFPYFQVICGDAGDVLKVAELSKYCTEHFKRLEAWHVYPFSFSGQVPGDVPEHEKLKMQQEISLAIAHKQLCLPSST